MEFPIRRGSDGERTEKRQEIIGQDSGFAIVEAYKTIRTNLMFALPKTGCKKIIVTSAVPKEGKSCSIINLAITLAMAGNRVLVIDCDMRKPDLHRLLRLKQIPGLSEVLGGMALMTDVIQDVPSLGLKAICAGTAPPNPAELLGSGTMAETLDLLSSEYDYILMDTPPVNLVSDALALSRMSDGVILIVREKRTTHTDLGRASAGLKFADAKVLGVIINDVQNGTAKHYMKYRYGEAYRGAPKKR